MREDKKILQDLSDNEKEFYKTYGTFPTKDQLKRFKPPKRITFSQKDLQTKVSMDYSRWKEKI